MDMTNVWGLDYWNSGEYQVAREKLDDDQNAGYIINPQRKSLFAALSKVSMDRCRVAIIGQDPYPDVRFATGYAFSIPEEYKPSEFPSTLRQIFAEYRSDLGYPSPTHGDLSRWMDQGVLLWNAIPSCRAGVPLSHDWPGREWEYLTREIVRRLSARSIVFAFLGSVARRHLGDVGQDSGSEVILTSHPSPRGSLNSKVPFRGSRLFSTINDKLVGLGMKPVDWRLDDGGIQTVSEEGSRILQNETGAELPGLPNKTGPKYAKSTFELEGA